MRESLRKPILFLVIVSVGSVLVLFDIPLVILLPLVLLVGFVTLLALGSVTIAEIRAGIGRLGKRGILKRLNDIRFFEKKEAGSKAAPQPAPVKTAPKKEAAKEAAKGGRKPGFRAHLSAFVSSLRSLGSVLQQRSRPGKKVEEINKLLDHTVTEKVSAPPPSAQKPAPASPAPTGGGGIGGASAKTAPDDPFFSLSGDDFDEELLKGLGEDEDFSTPPEPAAAAGALSIPDLPAEESLDTALPAPDISTAAGDILRDSGEIAGGEADGFSGPGEDGGLSDSDFGDLENLDLDDIGLDADTGDMPGNAPSPEPAAAAGTAPAAPAAGGNAVKTAWIPSDAPKDAGEIEDDISTQADMASFASGAGADEDLLSSIASDVKHTKKDVDISLVRDLKDFRAPASEIEQELGGMYERMNLAGQTLKKKTPPPKGSK